MRFCLKDLLVHPIMRIKNNLLIYKLYFLEKKNTFITRRLLHRLYSSINSSERKYMFLVNIQRYWGLEILENSRLARFPFCIKGSCYLIWCFSIVISLVTFLRFLKSKYANFFQYFSKQGFFNLSSLHLHCYFTHQNSKVFEVEICKFVSVLLKTMLFVIFWIFRHSFFKFLHSRIHWKCKEGFFQFVL